MIDEKAKSTVAKALYEAMEGPVSNQDFARQQRQWESAQALAVVAIEAYESAKPKEAEGLKLGSRLTVEGVEAVVVPVEPSDEMLRSALAVEFPATYRTNLRHPADGPGARGMTNARIDAARTKYRAMLSAAGDRE